MDVSNDGNLAVDDDQDWTCPVCGQPNCGDAIRCINCDSPARASDAEIKRLRARRTTLLMADKHAALVEVPPRPASWIAFLIGLLIWVYPLAPSTAFLFDAGGAQTGIPTRSLAWSIWSYPLFHLSAVAGSRIALRLEAPAHVVRIWARLHFISIGWLLLSLAWIELVCAGKLSCF